MIAPMLLAKPEKFIKLGSTVLQLSADKYTQTQKFILGNIV